MYKINKLILVLLLLNIDESLAYVYDPCELANELVQVHQMHNDEVPDWICLIYTESSFRTTALGPVGGDKSRDYGLFQINSFYWCNSSRSASSFNVCGRNCTDFLNDDLSDDLECARVIHSIHGFRAWQGYVTKCAAGNVSRIVFSENCDEVPTTDSPLIQYIHKSKPFDELPQLPDYAAKRDYSPFVFREELLRRAAKNKKKQKNSKQVNARVAGSVVELDVNKEANERTVVQLAANGLPDGLAIRRAMMTTTSKPTKIKKQLLNRKQTPTSLKNNLANFGAGSGSNESTRTVATELAGNSREKPVKRPIKQLDKQRREQCEKKWRAGDDFKNNCATKKKSFRQRSKQTSEANARKFNLIKWTRTAVVKPATVLLQQSSGWRKDRQAKPNRMVKPFRATSNYRKPSVFLKRFGIDF